MTTKRTRRASRLSEGGSSRIFDYEIAYDGKKPFDEIVAGPKSEAQRVFSITKASSTWRNALYYSDNVRALRSLLSEDEVRGKVKLIYIDPPFSTGSIFESRNGNTAYDDVASGAAYVDRFTVIAIAIIAYAIANVSRELIGHCTMAVLVGTRWQSPLQHLHSSRLRNSYVEVQHHRPSRFHRELHSCACLSRVAAHEANRSTKRALLPVAHNVCESFYSFHLHRSCSDHQVRRFVHSGS